MTCVVSLEQTGASPERLRLVANETETWRPFFYWLSSILVTALSIEQTLGAVTLTNK